MREPETDRVVRLLAEGRAAISRLSEAEVSSALARRRREGDLGTAQYAAAVQALRRDLASLDVVELAPEVLGRVHDLQSRHGLRVADALQLASALSLRPDGDVAAELVCFDDRLRTAARAEGFVVVPD